MQKIDLKKLKTKSNVPGINRNEVYKLQISLPPLEEQKKIAGILSQIQQAIELQDKLIEATTELKKSTMKHLFTYGTKEEKTKQNEFDQIPMDWCTFRIKDIGTVVTGTTPRTSEIEYYGDKYKLISPADLDKEKYVTTAHRMLSQKGLEQCKILLKHSVLVGCIGNVGKMGMTLDEKSATNQQVNAIVCNKKTNPHFVFYYLSYAKNRLQSTASQTTVPILNKTNFEQFVIPVPPLEEQKEIADILTKIDKKIETHQNKKQPSTNFLKPHYKNS